MEQADNISASFKSFYKDLMDNRDIVLFLGAGVNISKGVQLGWSDIIKPLITKTLLYIGREKGIDNSLRNDLIKLFTGSPIDGYNIPTPDLLKLKDIVNSEFGPLLQMSIVKAVLGMDYIKILQDYIYNQCNKDILKKAFEDCYALDNNGNRRSGSENEFYSLYVLARYIILYPHIKAIVTYNYDNFLTYAVSILQSDKEKYFNEKEVDLLNKRKRVNLIDVWDNNFGCAFSSDSIMVYHVHGYIPSPREFQEFNEDSIVLSLEEFCNSINSPNSWFSITPLYFLSHYTCVMAGISVSDINTQRMFLSAKVNANYHKRYLLTAYNNSMDDSTQGIKKAMYDIKCGFYAHWGLSLLKGDNGYFKLYEQLNCKLTEYLKGKNYEN